MYTLIILYSSFMLAVPGFSYEAGCEIAKMKTKQEVVTSFAFCIKVP